MTIGTRIFTKLRGQFVGEDEFGNRYYQDKKTNTNGRKKRWVMYNGMAEPSKVPPSWHGWLHYTTDEILENKYDWQKAATPNLTGTSFAYYPAGAKQKVGERKKVSSDYEAWEPK